MCLDTKYCSCLSAALLYPPGHVYMCIPSCIVARVVGIVKGCEQVGKTGKQLAACERPQRFHRGAQVSSLLFVKTGCIETHVGLK